MMANPNIDHTSSNFEYPKLTKIQGNPTYEPLQRIKNKLKANSASVPSDLGRGAHGHLGLMLTVPESENVSRIGYIQPLHSGALVIETSTTNYEATRRTDEYKELIRLNYKANNVDSSLLNHLSQALPIFA